MQDSSSNAQGVVPGPGYQPLRNMQRSNTAGKHSAQQQLSGTSPLNGGIGNGPQQNLPTTSSGQRATSNSQKKYKEHPHNQQHHPQVYHHQPHSNPNFAAAQSVGQVLESKKPISDPYLKKSNVVNQSPRPAPGGGQIQIQQIIRSHYQQQQNGQQVGGGGSGVTAQTTGGNKGKVGSRPLRSSRQQLSNSVVNQPSAATGDKNGSHIIGAGGHRANHQQVSSMTQNQTPNISNFHPPAIQKHEGGGSSSRRNARHAQINKNHPDLLIQNCKPSQIAYSYSKRNQQQQQQAVHSGGGHLAGTVTTTTAKDQSQASGKQQQPVGKFVRPSTASETRKLQQEQVQKSQTITTSPNLMRQGLVPQPAAPFNGYQPKQQSQQQQQQQQQQTGDSILASSSRNRRANATNTLGSTNARSTKAGGSLVKVSNVYPSPTNQVATQAALHRSHDKMILAQQSHQVNPMSLSHDQQLLTHRRPLQTKEDTFFPDKKQHGVDQQPPQLNTIGNFNDGGGGGLTDRGPQSNRIKGSQTLDAFGRSQALNNSTPLINPLLGQHNQASNGGGGHQRITSQNQTIPQYRKANLRDLRKSQRQSQQQYQQQPSTAKDSSQQIGFDDAKAQMINPLTSAELNSHFNKRTSGVPQGSSVSSKHASKYGGASQGTLVKNLETTFEHSGTNFKNNRNGKETTNRSLDLKRQLLIPGSNGASATSQGHMNKSLQLSQQNSQPPNNNGNSQAQNTTLLPTGFKRRANKRHVGQSLNQIQLHQQNPLANAFGGDQQHLHQKDSNRKRLELATMNNGNQNNPPATSRQNGSDQQQMILTERNKQSRQKTTSNSFDAAHRIQNRVPSAHSIKRGNSSKRGTADIENKTTPSQQAETPSKVNKSGAPRDSNERFNAITKFAFATSCGHQPGNPYKVNQDTYTLSPNMCGQQGFHLFAVCDGHGVNGHKVSGDIKVEMPQQLEQLLQTDQDFLQNQQTAEFQERIPRYFRDAFDQIHTNLMTNKPYDAHLSGSTVCAILFDSLRIYCANAGDSRAVLYTQGKKGGLKVTPLSEDHKPSLPKEKARVEKMGGRVNPIIGPQGQHLGPDRVWMATEDTPGLAMSRSLGDGLAHSVGVSWEPEVKQLTLEPADKFIVIASDGVWEFLSNEQIARIVWPYYIKNSPEQAGNAIVRASAQKWKENDTVIDDITCITIFLEVD